MSKNSLPEFGIVKWLDDGLFSTIKLKGCFFIKKKEIPVSDLALNQQYKALMWLKDAEKPQRLQRYKCQLLFMGAYEQCESQMENITKKYEVNTNLKGTATKNSAKNHEIAKKHKQQTPCNSTSQPEYELLANLEDLKNENNVLKLKIKEMEANINEYKIKYEKVNEENIEALSTIQELTEKLKATQDDNLKDFCTNQQKLIDLSVYIMNKFGQQSDMSRIVFQVASQENPLSDMHVSFVDQPQFSHFKIPMSTKNNIERLFLAKKSSDEAYSNKLIIRKLFNVVLSDDTWAKHNLSSLMKEHDKLLMACKTFMLLNRPDFNDKEFHYAIRNKICDAKKRVKKLNNQDQQECSSSSSDSSIDHPPTNTTLNTANHTFFTQPVDNSYQSTNNQVYTQYEHQNLPKSRTQYYQSMKLAQSSQMQSHAYLNSYGTTFPRFDSFLDQNQ